MTRKWFLNTISQQNKSGCLEGILIQIWGFKKISLRHLVNRKYGSYQKQVVPEGHSSQFEEIVTYQR